MSDFKDDLLREKYFNQGDTKYTKGKFNIKQNITSKEKFSEEFYFGKGNHDSDEILNSGEVSPSQNDENDTSLFQNLENTSKSLLNKLFNMHILADFDQNSLVFGSEREKLHIDKTKFMRHVNLHGATRTFKNLNSYVKSEIE